MASKNRRVLWVDNPDSTKADGRSGFENYAVHKTVPVGGEGGVGSAVEVAKLLSRHAIAMRPSHALGLRRRGLMPAVLSCSAPAAASVRVGREF